MKSILLAILTLTLFGCSQKWYLEQDEIQWNPYKKGEILVFQSQSNELDTIFIEDVIESSFIQGMNGMKYNNEEIKVFVKHTDPNYDRYLQIAFLEIEAGNPEEKSKIRFLLAAKEAWFYDSERTIEELKSLREKPFNTPFGTFNDVIKISDRDTSYSSPDNAVKLIYWSKSEGYVGFESNDEKWVIMKKYKP
ncbi:MAG: hypothetical protein ACO1OF_14680 [Adhaeribacter sp.]